MTDENEGSRDGESSGTQPTAPPLLWDPALPLEINLNRLNYEGIFDVMGRYRDSQKMIDQDNEKTEMLSLMDRTSAELNKMKKDRDEYLGQIATLEEKNPQFAFPPPPLSVLTWIQRYLRVFFSRGSQNASQLYLRLEVAVRCQRTTVDKFRVSETPPNPDGLSVPWSSLRLAMSLVLVLAASPEEMYETLKRYTRSLSGGPIALARVRDTTSTSLRAAMAKAEGEARGSQHLNVVKSTTKMKDHLPPKITILGVNFIDINYLKNSASIPGFEECHTSFSRYFVIGAGPEGFIVWQAGGDGSYGLNEFIKRGSDRIRDWSEAPKFLADFERLAVEKGSWNSKKYKSYHRCFDVDLRELGKERPVLPNYETKVQIHKLENVQGGHIHKFNWL
ncbi:hypothetical protein MMC22_002855 [Lobaria immixta]|nr:hypothetical protein [Lobaria immixta]